MDFDDEPFLRLASGALVNTCTLDLMFSLQRRGHVFGLDGEGRLTVTRADELSEDAAYLLEVSTGDIVELVKAERSDRVH